MAFLNPIANWIRSWKMPTLLKQLLDKLQLLILSRIKEISGEVIRLLIEKVKALESENLSGEEKFKKLVEYGKQLGIDTIDKDFVNSFFNLIVFTVKAKF